MPPPQGRRSFRARRRHPQHGRCRPFSRPPEPPTRAPARMGELLRGSGPWTHRRGAPARPACPPSARRERSDSRLRRGHERLDPMRRGVQPRARILLPPIPPLGGAAHRGRMGLPVRRTAELRPRELDRARGCRARPTRPRRQRGRRRAGEGLAGPARERKDRSPVRLRRGLRSRQGPAGTGESAVPDPRPFAGGSLLPRRPEPRRPTRPHRAAASPRAQDEVLDPSTWPEPSTEYACEDAGYGTVRVRAFSKLHPKVRAHEGRGSRGPLPIAVGTLILVEVERLPRGERRREPRVLWLWWHGPEGEAPDLGLLWRSYVRHFDLEHTFRFLKQSMGWTTPRVRHPQQADRWTWLVLAAFTQLRLARACVADLRLPWERRYEPARLTPMRVHRAVSALLAHVGTPAEPPKPCGRSPGRPKGRLSGRAERYPALKKSA